MCKDCGCGETPHHRHHHDHGGVPHSHEPGGPVHVHPPSDAVLKESVERSLLADNDESAAKNRKWMEARGITALNIISSPGSGKTTLLEKTLDRLRGRIKCAVITGDQRTDHDARRLEGRGAPVIQIETFNACHLDARRVGECLPRVADDGARLLFIENVGNLVCPAAFDLGESFKVALLSVTEGEDKPAKYPALFSSAPVTVLTKLDLVPHLDWDSATCLMWLRKTHPGAFVFQLSARTGEGMDAWIDYLAGLAG
ncbi:MAG: hydrogenase nickel incorporation protein HypB [Lentisphaerae bacterium]|nr:hydrogenase nickel incorporation protein HypB [Lentisphaerota bacterium]